MLKIADTVALILYCSFIFFLSSRPSLPAPMLFMHQDKLYHAVAYFIMGLLAWRSLRSIITAPRGLFLVSVAVCSVYGMSDEWHQSFVEGRQADVLDWVADTVGAFTAIFIAMIIRQRISST